MAKAPTRRRYRGDTTRRSRLMEEAATAGISHGAYRWLGEIAARSNATLTKPVYGRQTGQAERIDRSERSVRTYRRECEEAGLIKVIRSQPERRPDGTFGRVFTNIYRFIVRPLRRAQKSSSDRAAADCRSNLSYSVTDEETFHDERPVAGNSVWTRWRRGGNDLVDEDQAAAENGEYEGQGFSPTWFAETRKLLGSKR